MVGWFKRAPCRIEDFIFVDARYTTFRHLRAPRTTVSSVMSFSENLCVMIEPISLTMDDFIPDILYFICCKLFSSKESIDTPCTIIVLESASCSTWSIDFNFQFLYSCLMDMMIELFTGRVTYTGKSSLCRVAVTIFVSLLVYLTPRVFWKWRHSMTFSSKFFTLHFLLEFCLVVAWLLLLLFFQGVRFQKFNRFVNIFFWATCFQLETHYL